MYLGDSLEKVRTSQRPAATRLTAPPNEPHHKLEDILAKPSTRRLLGWLTELKSDNKCLFERLCENYDNPELTGLSRVAYGAATAIIDCFIRHYGGNREALKARLFHHPPTVRALALTARSIAKYGFTAPQRFVAPLTVVWNFTQACNLTCKHCYQVATRRPLSDELTLEERLMVVDQLAAAGVPFLALAGGEPLVSKDIWPVLEHARRNHIHLTLATNGTLLTPETAARLRECGVRYVEVSVDSVRPEEHDRFRGQPGAWARSVQGIRNSVAAGIRTAFAACITRHTANQVDDLVNFAIDLGCSTFSHFNFIPVGRGIEMAGDDLEPEQREMVLRRLNDHLQEARIGIFSTAPQFGRNCIMYGALNDIYPTGHAGLGAGEKTRVLARYLGGCGAGRCYCSIQPNGAVTPCVYMPSPEVGNLRTQTLLDLFNSEPFRILADRDDRGDHCAVCDYKLYCGGCRARAFAYTGDMTAGDPGCIYNRHVWDAVLARKTADGAAARENDAKYVQLSGMALGS
jgi:radical SAM protein with 4Fe4S-binding SPASM domain